MKRIYDPNVALAIGACACTGGVFVNGRGIKLQETHAVIGGVDKVLPVDVYVLGCPPKPEAIIQRIIKAIENLKEK